MRVLIVLASTGYIERVLNEDLTDIRGFLVMLLLLALAGDVRDAIKWW